MEYREARKCPPAIRTLRVAIEGHRSRSRDFCEYGKHDCGKGNAWECKGDRKFRTVVRRMPVPPHHGPTSIVGLTQHGSAAQSGGRTWLIALCHYDYCYDERRSMVVSGGMGWKLPAIAAAVIEDKVRHSRPIGEVELTCPGCGISRHMVCYRFSSGSFGTHKALHFLCTTCGGIWTVDKSDEEGILNSMKPVDGDQPMGS